MQTSIDPTIEYLSRITMDANICHGKPCIRDMRWPVEFILDMMLSGMSFQEILEDHPELEHADLMACLAYAKVLVSGHKIITAA
jgi:uncharacterized protein (DUF433 family)